MEGGCPLDCKEAIIIFENTAKMDVVQIERCGVGTGNYVFIITTTMDKFILRCSEEKDAYKDAIFLLDKLSVCDIPIPVVLMEGIYGNYSYLILSYIDGDDIGNQKDDLQNEVDFLKQFCNAKGMIVNQCIEDFGSGLNYNRKKWNKLFDDVMRNRIKTIIIMNKDRFIRFGYDWFEKFCEKFNTKIIIVKNETLSPKEELVQDMIAILHVFRCRLYGLRKYINQIKEDEEIVKELQNGNKSKSGTDTKDQSDHRHLQIPL